MEEFQDLVILAAGWRLISEIKYDSTVTPIFVLVTFPPENLHALCT